jgi:hypothetical protein
MTELEQLTDALSRQDPRYYESYFENVVVRIFDEVAGLIEISRREQLEALESKYLKVIAAMCEGTAVPAVSGQKQRWASQSRKPTVAEFRRVQVVMNAHNPRLYKNKTAYLKAMGEKVDYSRQWFNKWISAEELTLP